MLKSLFNWKVLLNLLLAAAIFVGIVWLTFRWLEQYTNHGEEIPVPNVVNLKVHDAIKVLDDAGLVYEVDSGTYNPKFKSFQVLNVFPSPGSRVKGGREVTLTVNPRSWAPVQVPDIIDRYKGLAFSRLERVGLKVGDTIYEPNIQKDAVIRMVYNNASLKPGTLLPRFSTIDLVIGTGPMRNIAIPRIVGLTVAEAKAIIANNLFEVGLVEHEDGKGDPSDIVYYQDPAPGDLRDQGMQIDLWASKKTPAELQSKISYLNSIYRIKIDTSLPPVRFEEAPVYNEPSYTPPPPPTDNHQPATPVQNTQQQPTTKTQSTTPTKTQDKPTNQTAPKKTTSTPTNNTKPEVKEPAPKTKAKVE